MAETPKKEDVLAFDNRCPYPLPAGSDFTFSKDGIDSSGNTIKCDRGISVSDNGKWLACGYSTERILGSRSVLGELFCGPSADGACCYSDGTCAEVSAADCGASGGIFFGSGISCNKVNCESPATGACCIGGVCSILTSNDCFSSDGVYMGDNIDCSAVSCAFDCLCSNSNISSCETIITDSGGDFNDEFGYSVSIDGNVAIVGAPMSDSDYGSAGSAGSALIFRFDGQEWTQEQKLVPIDSIEDHRFGTSVSISGSLAIVGATGDNTNGPNSGAAYIFRFYDSQWTQEAKLLPQDADTDDGFGGSVGIHGDTAIVGSVSNNAHTTEGSIRHGSVYSFSFDVDVSGWVQKQQIVPPDDYALERDTDFGGGVSISNNRLLIMSINYSPVNLYNGEGAAFVYNKYGDQWTLDTKLVASDRDDNDFFGSSGCISGNNIIIGARHYGSESSGPAYIFNYDVVSEQWGNYDSVNNRSEESQQLPAPSDIGDNSFGSWSVSVGGNLAIVDVAFDDSFDSNSGAVYIYEFLNNGWVEKLKLTASDASASSKFGFSSAIWVNGDYYKIIIGAYDGLTESAYIYSCCLGAACESEGDPVGACCLGTTCSVETAVSCELSGGWYLGDNSFCGTQCGGGGGGNPWSCCLAGYCFEHPPLSNPFRCWQNGGVPFLVNACHDNIDCTASGRCCVDGSIQCNISKCECDDIADGKWLGEGWGCNDAMCEGDVLGGCCIGEDCIYVTYDQCMTDEGFWLGEGWTRCGYSTSCLTDLGACCYEDFTGNSHCSIMEPFVCSYINGTYKGNGSSCPADCSTVCSTPGACCVDEECFIYTEEKCEDEDGDYFGEGSICEIGMCIDAGDGACCVAEECFIYTEWECWAAHGVYQGEGSTCEDVDCWGMCCVDGECSETTEEDCDGAWYGGLTCEQNGFLCQFTAGDGACCFPFGCANNMTEEDCSAAHGDYQGEGSTCEDVDCTSRSTEVGACCIDNQCIQLTEDECGRSNGNYLGDNEGCDTNSCSSSNYDRVYTEEVAIYKMNEQLEDIDGSEYDLVAVVQYPYNEQVDRLQETTYGYFLNAINGNCFDLEEYDISINENGTLLSISGYTLNDDGTRFPYILTWYREDYSGYNWSLVQDTRFLDWSNTTFNNASAFKSLTINRGRVMALEYQFDNSSSRIIKIDKFNRENPKDISLSTAVDVSDSQSQTDMSVIHSFDITVGYMGVLSGSFDSICIIKESVDVFNPDLHWRYNILRENHTDLLTLEDLSKASYDLYVDDNSPPTCYSTENSTHIKMKNFLNSGICLVTTGVNTSMSIDVYKIESGSGDFSMRSSTSDWVLSPNGLPQNPSCAYQRGLDPKNLQRGIYCKHISESTGLCLLSDPRFGSYDNERGRIYPYLFLGEEDENGYDFTFCHTMDMPPIVNGKYSSGIEYGGRYSSNLFGFSCFSYEVGSRFYFASLSCLNDVNNFVSFYEFNSSSIASESRSVDQDVSAAINIRRYMTDISPGRWDKKFKSGYVGFSNEDIVDVPSMSLSDGKINILNGNVFSGEEGVVLRSMSSPDSDEDEGAQESSSPGSLDVEIISDKSQSIYSQFGVLFYNGGFGGAFGDGSALNLNNSTISAKANSVTGIFEINDTLTKYDNVKVDIKGAAFKDVGVSPHIVLEDTFEGVNSGLPSFLSQVQQMNILRNGLSLKRRNPYDFDNTFIPYQSNYVLSCDTGWYDKFNSTIDFFLQKHNNPLGVTLSFPSTIFEKEEDKILWIGGPGGVLQINGLDYSVSTPDVLSDYNLTGVVRIKKVGSEILVLSQGSLIIIDEQDNSEFDPLYGVSGRATDVTRIYNGTYTLSTDNGIYVRKSGSSSYNKVYEVDAFNSGTADRFFLLESVAGFVFAISENDLHLTRNGLLWGSLQGDTPNSEINSLLKFRNGHILLTNFGAFYDNGSMLEESFNFQLLPVLGSVGSGVDNSSMRANDAGGVVKVAEDGSILQSELIIVFADGSYSISTTSLDNFTNYEENSFSVIHKVIRFQNKWLIFSFDNFKFIDDDNIYRLSTGLRI